MNDPLEEWLSKVHAYLLVWPYCRQVATDYAEAGDGVAQYRLRAVLLDGSLLQCVERIRLLSSGLVTEKYSFHWQRADGSQICRWDNAPHHREVATFPHHVHEGDENQVLEHEAVDVFGMLEKVEKVLMDQGE